MTTFSFALHFPARLTSALRAFSGKRRRQRMARREAAPLGEICPGDSAGELATKVFSGCPGPLLEEGVVAEIKRYAFVRWLLRALTASLFLNAFAAAILILAAIAAGRRVPLQLHAKPSLRAEAASLFGRDTQVNVDDLLLYLNTVLPLIHRLDDRGAPDLPLLRGLISAHEYEIARAEAARDVALAKKNFVVQSLVLTRVEDVVADNEHGRISAYVRGYLAIIVQSTNRPVVIPYRAEVLLEMAPPSRLNRFPFVLIRREWKINRAALAWDEMRGDKDEKGETPAPGTPRDQASRLRGKTS